MGTWADHEDEIRSAAAQLPQLPWSLRYMLDEHGRDTGFAVLRGHIQDHERQAFEVMAADHRFIGWMQWWAFPVPHYSYGGERYQAVPSEPPAPDLWDRPEIQACEAWAHCVRTPDDFLPPRGPRFLISNSDFVDTGAIWRAAHGTSRARPPKRWDVICCYSAHWYDEIQKNWSLARACVEVLVRELNLSVLLLARGGMPNVPLHPNVEVRPRVSWQECIGCMARSRIVLFPHHIEPSPRSMMEALALDVPVLVNSEILGGWKYVNDETGRFFDDAFDVAAQARELLSSSLQPRAWVRRHYGRDLAARRLATHLRSLGGANDVRYAFSSALLGWGQ
jgi:hypothetical protein